VTSYDRQGFGDNAGRSQRLQRSFENAVRDVGTAGVTGSVSHRRTPIAQRPSWKSESATGAEKRAVSDAAKALSALWKLAPNSGR